MDLLDPSVACPAAPVEELRQVRLEAALVPFPDERLGQHFVGSASRDVLLDGRRSYSSMEVRYRMHHMVIRQHDLRW